MFHYEFLLLLKEVHKTKTAIYNLKNEQDERWERFPIPQEINPYLHNRKKLAEIQCIWEVGLNTKQSKLMFSSVHLACPKFAATDTSYFLSQPFTQPPSALITCVWTAVFGCAVETGQLQFSRSYCILHCESGGGFNVTWEKPCCSLNFNLMSLTVLHD